MDRNGATGSATSERVVEEDRAFDEIPDRSQSYAARSVDTEVKAALLSFADQDALGHFESVSLQLILLAQFSANKLSHRLEATGLNFLRYSHLLDSSFHVS